MVYAQSETTKTKGRKESKSKLKSLTKAINVSPNLR